jgi:hypothetical protein
MNLDTFIKHLRGLTKKTNVRRWLKSSGGDFKCRSCPITSVVMKRTHKHYPTDLAIVAATKELKMDNLLASEIIYAADSTELEYGTRRKIRDRMLVAVGLKAGI